MTSKEILTKVIEKAVEGGWDKPYPYASGFTGSGERIRMCGKPIYLLTIFSHDFAKAFWPNEDVELDWVSPRYYLSEGKYLTEFVPFWIFHLQQMVLEEEPLKYLEKFL